METWKNQQRAEIEARRQAVDTEDDDPLGFDDDLLHPQNSVDDVNWQPQQEYDGGLEDQRPANDM